MFCYPVIYTRTLNCDYFTNFHVLPDFVDAKWLLPYVRSATTDMTPSVSTIRKIVITNEDVCVFGIIAYAKDIMNSYLGNFFSDNKGRAVYGFYGFAVKANGNSAVIPAFSETKISEMYYHYITPVWEDLIQKTQTSSYVMLDEKTVYDLEIEPEYIYNDSVNVFSNEKNLYEILLYKALNGKSVSYCSCINDYKALKQTPFNYVITSANNLVRLKNEPVVREEPVIIHNEPDEIPEKSIFNESLNSNRIDELQRRKQMGRNIAEQRMSKQIHNNNPLKLHETYDNDFRGTKKNNDKNERRESSFFNEAKERDSFSHQETFSEKRLRMQLTNLLGSYSSSERVVAMAVHVSVTVISCIFKMFGMKEED